MEHSLQTILEIHKKTKQSGYNNPENTINEFEVRFGTKYKTISKIDFDNVIRKIKSCGYHCDNEEGEYSLKIFNDVKGLESKLDKLSSIRVEIEGLQNVKQYCKTNSLKDIIGIKFVNKKYAYDADRNSILPIEKPEYNFRYTYNSETTYDSTNPTVALLLEKWDSLKKLYRYINRLRFYKKDSPIKIDLSIVKTNKNKNGRYITTNRLEETNIFNNNDIYEIEIELDGEIDNIDLTSSMIKSTIKLILSALQGSNFPISYIEHDNIIKDYAELINIKKKITPRQFIGPSSLTLQYNNITSDTDNINVPSVRNNYTVTDKADGTRKLLYIHKSKKIYLITTNMQIQFTGLMVKSTTFIDTIIDGEHIINNKDGKYINLFMAFDIYYLNGKSVREYIFVDETKEFKNNMRLYILMNLIKQLDLKYVSSNNNFSIKCKQFYISNENTTIFDACNKVLINNYEYETDGLIFTPKLLPVAGDSVGKSGPLIKHAWKHSFKWKPPEYNTNDFLISVKKDEQGNDIITNKFKNGTNVRKTNIEYFKTLILRVGYDEKKHGYINPCQMILDDDIGSDNKSNYKPVPFYPSDPYDNTAHICNLKLVEDQNNNLVMKTEENEVFENNMIVEFKYTNGQWVPLRVRYDKTQEYRNGEKNYGNAYHVANSNWNSIHNPITEDMLKTGQNIPKLSDQVYFNRTNKTNLTTNLRQFHNMEIKRKLISIVSKPGMIFCDLAVGKGGDLSKWIANKLKFVFGIDIMGDCINNPIDGVCARYLNAKKKYKKIPYGIFVKGNCALNIKNGTALFNEKDKSIVKAIFGNGPNDVNIIGPATSRQYAVASNGFDIVSCQFAMHYFFKNIETLKGFIRNVVECTKLNGYFIGTCYDGKKIFDILENKKKGESISLYNEGNCIWEITKEYDNEEFNNNISSVGYPITVFQESINKTFREYLVNFDYLTYVLKNYGLEIVDINNVKGLASFENLYLNKYNLSDNEKFISFNNNYFIFQKKIDVDINEIDKILFKSKTNIIKRARKIKKLKLVQKS